MTMEIGLAHALRGSSDRPLIVFLHGFMGTKSDWDVVSMQLESRFHVMAVDIPGHGDSPFPNEPRYGVADFCADLIERIDGAGHGTFSLAGYSMGGRIALYFASVYAMRIDSLILESASPGIEDKLERESRRSQDEIIARRLESVDFDVFLAEWYRQPIFESLARRPDLLKTAIDARRGSDPARLARALRAFGPGTMPSVWRELAVHQIPTLCITGELDGKFTELAKARSARCGAIQRAVVAGTGHNVHLEQPTQYTTLLHQFLSNHVE